MTHKTIEVHYDGPGQCILEVDEKYFGYDDSKPYPEAMFNNQENAFVFKDVKSALDTASWYSGSLLRILKYHPITHHKMASFVYVPRGYAGARILHQTDTLAEMVSFLEEKVIPTNTRSTFHYDYVDGKCTAYTEVHFVEAKP